MAKAISYVVITSAGYSDTAADYTACKTRAAVEAELVDLGYLQNPGLFVYKVVKGQDPAAVILELADSIDPYPDWVVERGPRGGYVWQIA